LLTGELPVATDVAVWWFPSPSPCFPGPCALCGRRTCLDDPNTCQAYPCGIPVRFMGDDADECPDRVVTGNPQQPTRSTTPP